MKFEITSFVAAIVVYLVRLRIQYVSETRPLYSSSYLDNRSNPDAKTSDSQAADSAMRSTFSSGIHSAAGFPRGCSRAV